MSTHTESSSPSPTILKLTLHLNSHYGLLVFLLIIIFIQFPPPATAQLPNTLSPPPADTVSKLNFDKSMAIVLVILVVVFFLLGFFSVFTRRCTERRIRQRFELTLPIGSGSRRSRGLDPEIIDTFPTFVYSSVKALKIGRAALECAVCLNEFQDDETLRLIPKCSHVFHPECIDAWLANHSTCPVCRANLFPRPGELSFVALQIQDSDSSGSRPEPDDPPGNETQIDDVSNRNGAGVAVAESPKVNKSLSINQNRPSRSRSTGFRIGSLFPRSHSTGHSLVQRGENLERFTLRLPEEVRNHLLSSSLSRTKSLGVSLTRESSSRTGYRTGSVGSARGRTYLQLERFGRSDQRGFSLTPPFVSRAGSSRSRPSKGSTESNKGPVPTDEVGERSSDRLFAGSES